MTADEVLKAMETYGLTLRRIMPIDENGKEREAGWLCKVSGRNHGSLMRWARFHTGYAARFNDFFGKTPQEAVKEAIKSIKE